MNETSTVSPGHFDGQTLVGQRRSVDLSAFSDVKPLLAKIEERVTAFGGSHVTAGWKCWTNKQYLTVYYNAPQNDIKKQVSAAITELLAEWGSK